MEAAWLVPVSSPALTTAWICFTVAPGSVKNPQSLLQIFSQLVCLRPAGILSNVICQFELFVSVVCSAPIYSIVFVL